jgi:hypothetical protein
MSFITLYSPLVLSNPPARTQTPILSPCKYQIYPKPLSTFATHPFLQPTLQPFFLSVLIVEPINVWPQSKTQTPCLWWKTIRFCSSWPSDEDFPRTLMKGSAVETIVLGFQVMNPPLTGTEWEYRSHFPIRKRWNRARFEIVKNEAKWPSNF